MKKGVFLTFLLILAAFFAGCDDAVLPDLPEMEESMDVDVFEIGDDETHDDDSKPAEENTDGEEKDDSDDPEKPDQDTSDDVVPEPEIAAAHLIVAEVGGYNVPMSGKVYYAKDENLNEFKEIPVEGGMGSVDGADLNLAVFDSGFAAVGRDKSSSLYFFTQDFKFESEIRIKPDVYINMQDMVFNPFKDEYIVSALNSDTYDAHKKYSNKVFILKKGVQEASVSELEISDNESATPAKMRVVGKKLFVALQNLNDQALSDKGEIAVVSLEDYSIKRVELPLRNPTGKIEYNAKVDKNHIYFVATGNWQKRDGALLRMDIETYEVKVVLRESAEENNILDGDFVDVSIADNGGFYIIFSNNSSKWENNLLEYLPAEGKVTKIDSGINAFAANPIDFSPKTGRIYYFIDDGPDTYLKFLDTKTGQSESVLLEYGPASLRVKIDSD